MAIPEEFYGDLAGDYHLLFDDWWTAAQEHGRLIAGLLRARGFGAGRVLDCTCGIGTQALPLAGLGYRVTGADVSGAAIDRARAEATARGLEVDLMVSDVRDVRDDVEGVFDIVISCDNALPHLLTDEDLRLALDNLHRCLRPGGLLLVSLRDYDSLRRTRPNGTPISIHGAAGSRHASGQTWQWSADANFVGVELFTFTESAPGFWQARSHATRYRALQRGILDRLLDSAGFAAGEWLLPDSTGYYQPIVIRTA